MKQKILAVLLLVTMILSMLPAGILAIERDDTTNIAAKDYAEDTFYMNDLDGGSSISSGSINRWNAIRNATKTNITDPQDEGNTVFSFATSGDTEASMIKNLIMGAITTQDSFVFSIDYKLPSPQEEGPSNEYFKLVLFGYTALSLTYDDTLEEYSGTFFGNSVVVPADKWVHYFFSITPSSSTVSSVDAQMSGALRDGNRKQITHIRATQSITRANTTFNACLKAKGGSRGVAYGDNVKIYQQGDFAPATVNQPIYANDIYKNYVLNGKVTITLYHDPDPATFNPDDVRLCNSLGEDMPYTTLTYNYANPRVLIYDFSEDPLEEYTDYYVCFGDSVRDMFGKSMYEPTIIFSTKGTEGSIPRPKDVVPMPKEGFVMPDTWNTGYRCDYEDLVPFSEKYGTTSTSITIDEAMARKYNYEFSHFTHTGRISVIATSPVYIHDFYVEGTMSNGQSGRPTSSARLTVAWGEFKGLEGTGDIFGGANMTISHCYAHDAKADFIKGTTGQIIEFNYFRDGGTRNPGAHADGVQFMGGSDSAGMHIRYIGNRIDMPNMMYDHVANCAYFYKPEAWSQGYVDVQAIGNWFNGGGYTVYLTPACALDLNQQIVFNHNKLGYGYTFGPMYNAFGKDEIGNPNLAQFGGSYLGSGLVKTLETGSIVYFNGTADKENRVFDVADVDGQSLTILVNFANYILSARDYRIEARILDADGNVVANVSKEGEVRRYIPVKEYTVSSNLKDTGLTNPENDNIIYELIEKPDLPQNVEETVTLEGLPTDMTGYTVEVSVYDTQNGEQLIRTSKLTDKVADNCRPNPDMFSVTFKDMDGTILSTERVELGESATPPVAPEKEGYEFSGWSGNYVNVQGNVTITAQYVKLCKVTFVGKDGAVLDTTTVRQGESVTAFPTPPEFEGYTFSGWSSDGKNIQGDITITAKYKWNSSDALKAFEAQVDILEGINRSNYTERYATLKATEEIWDALLDKEEVGATDLYARFMAQVNAYNEDVASINQTMADAIHLSCTTLDRGQNLSALQAVLLVK